MHELITPPIGIKEKHPALKEISPDGFPTTTIVIPDGNVRWATSQGLSSIEGHMAGGNVSLALVQVFVEIPEMQNLLTWGWSHDNWKRSNQETKGVMQVIEKTIQLALPLFEKHQIKFSRLGREEKIRGQFPRLWRTIQEAEEITKNYDRKKFGLLLDFSGDDQDLRMAQKLAEMKGQNPNLIVTEELWHSLRDGYELGFKPADLVIRTSGELRTSGIGWPGERAEFVSIQKNLPEIGEEDIVDALVEYSHRQRRLGGRPQIVTS